MECLFYCKVCLFLAECLFVNRNLPKNITGGNVGPAWRNVTSVYECQEICQNVTECTAWSYVHDTLNCWLKKSPVSLDNLIETDNVTSGPRYCPGEYKI